MLLTELVGTARRFIFIKQCQFAAQSRYAQIIMCKIVGLIFQNGADCLDVKWKSLPISLVKRELKLAHTFVNFYASYNAQEHLI